MTHILTALLLTGATTAWFAAIGRFSVPPAERIPLRRWRYQELISNVAIGHREALRAQRRIRGGAPGGDEL